MVDSNDEVSDVYILTDASLSDTDSLNEVSQKINVCYSDCDSEPSEFEKEDECHYSDEIDTEDFTEEYSDNSSSETVIIADSKNSCPSLNSFASTATCEFFMSISKNSCVFIIITTYK